MVFKARGIITDLLPGERSEFSGKSGKYYIIHALYGVKNGETFQAISRKVSKITVT